LGLTFNEGVTRYKWYGRHVGDYPIPAGFAKDDLGRCDHMISVTDNVMAYQIGVCQRKDGDGYTLLWDFWAGGHGLQDAVGRGAHKLIQGYQETVATKTLRRQRARFTRSVDADGTVRMEVY
jgi:hypothetical protein